MARRRLCEQIEGVGAKTDRILVPHRVAGIQSMLTRGEVELPVGPCHLDRLQGSLLKQCLAYVAPRLARTDAPKFNEKKPVRAATHAAPFL